MNKIDHQIPVGQRGFIATVSRSMWDMKPNTFCLLHERYVACVKAGIPGTFCKSPSSYDNAIKLARELTRAYIPEAEYVQVIEF